MGAMYVIARILCPYSQNGRVYPSGLLQKKAKEFIGVPIILGHGSNVKVGEILEAVYDNESRCVVAKIFIDENKLDNALLNALKSKKVAFSIEGEATKVSEIQGELVVEDFVVHAIAIVPEPGVNGARPMVVSDHDVKLLEKFKSGNTQLGRSEVMTENKPLNEQIEEQASGYAGPVTAPVNVNVNLNIVGGENTGDGKVQSQKGSERQDMLEGEENGNQASGSKFQVQRGFQARGRAPSQYEGLEEECLDEACKKRKKSKKSKKSTEELEDEFDEEVECDELDEACKKKKKKSKKSKKSMEELEEEDESEEEVDEACKKRKKSKKSMEELDDEEDDEIDEACKKKKKSKKKSMEELEEEDECDELDEACKKRKKKSKKSKEELDDDIEEYEVKQAMLRAYLMKDIEETLKELGVEDVDDITDEDLDELIDILDEDDIIEARKKCDDACIQKCKQLSKKYGIPCVLDKLGYSAHPECIGKPSVCCDPVNGFWPIDRPGRAKIAMYLMVRHWARMANRYGLKGWAKIVDCIVTKAKKFGINVKCDTLKQRTPNIWKFLTKAKKACVASEGIYMGESKMSTQINEGLFVAEPASLDLDEAFVKLTESLRNGVVIREDLNNAFDILQPIITKISEYTREGKLWGKLGKKIAVNRKNLVIGATIEVPYVDERTVEASVATSDATAPGVIDVSLTTTTPITVKMAQGMFSWTDDQARLIKSIGALATNVLSQAIVNVLDKEVATVLNNTAAPYNYDPNDVTTVPAPNVADIWNAMTDLVADGWKPKLAIMHPKVITELAKLDDTVKQALVYKKTLQPGDIIPMLGINVLVGDNYATPIVELTDASGNTVNATFVYVMDDSTVVEVEDPSVELASAYYPEQAKPYVLVARKRYGLGIVKPEAIKKLAFKM